MIESTDVRSCERHAGSLVQTIWKIQYGYARCCAKNYAVLSCDVVIMAFCVNRRFCIIATIKRVSLAVISERLWRPLKCFFLCWRLPNIIIINRFSLSFLKTANENVKRNVVPILFYGVDTNVQSYESKIETHFSSPPNVVRGLSLLMLYHIVQCRLLNSKLFIVDSNSLVQLILKKISHLWILIAAIRWQKPLETNMKFFISSSSTLDLVQGSELSRWSPHCTTNGWQ